MVVIVFCVNFANFIFRQKVELFNQFILSVRDLPLGSHNFDFKIKDWFFDKFEYSEIKKGEFNIKLTLDKQERIYFLHFVIDGIANVICDRCGDYFEQALKGEQELIIKIGNERLENEDDIIIIHEHENQIDITQYIYEYISLLLPMHNVHPNDSKGNSKCNKATLKLLDNLKPKHKEVTTENDPRWDELKKLIKS